MTTPFFISPMVLPVISIAGTGGPSSVRRIDFWVQSIFQVIGIMIIWETLNVLQLPDPCTLFEELWLWLLGDTPLPSPHRLPSGVSVIPFLSSSLLPELWWAIHDAVAYSPRRPTWLTPSILHINMSWGVSEMVSEFIRENIQDGILRSGPKP